MIRAGGVDEGSVDTTINISFDLQMQPFNPLPTNDAPMSQCVMTFLN